MDVERHVNETRKTGDLLRSRSMEDFKLVNGEEDEISGLLGIHTADQSDNAQMAGFRRQTVNTIWHYHGL